MKTLSIRSRMTLWYGLMMALIISGFAAAICLLAVRSFSSRIDFELVEEVDEIVQEINDEPDREALTRELTSEFAHHPAYEYEVLEKGAQALFRSYRLGQNLSLFVTGSDSSIANTQPLFEAMPSQSDVLNDVMLSPLGEYRVLSRRVGSPYGELVIGVAIPLQPLRSIEADLWRVVSVLGPCVLLVAIAGGYWMAGRMLAPIAEITSTASEITVRDLKTRLEVSEADDEISQLSRTFNGMIHRLDQAFEELHRFTADAAHELRTPLAVMRTQLDVALRNDRSAADYRKVLVSLLDDVVRMTKLATQLLELSREDTGLVPHDFRWGALHEVVQCSVQQFLPEAHRKEITIDVHDVATVELSMDAERLQRAIVNLLDNAVKYSPNGGRVVVRLTHASDVVRLEISDSGPGIPPEHLPRVFDRFYRTEQSRTSPGTGLGLAICKAIVAAHHGQIQLLSPSVDRDSFPTASLGTTAIIELPINSQTCATTQTTSELS